MIDQNFINEMAAGFAEYVREVAAVAKKTSANPGEVFLCGLCQAFGEARVKEISNTIDSENWLQDLFFACVTRLGDFRQRCEVMADFM